MSKSMNAFLLAGVLSLAAASAAQAGGKPTSGDFHSGASAATNGQSQSNNGGHVHNDGGKPTGMDFGH